MTSPKAIAVDNVPQTTVANIQNVCLCIGRSLKRNLIMLAFLHSFTTYLSVLDRPASPVDPGRLQRDQTCPEKATSTSFCYWLPTRNGNKEGLCKMFSRDRLCRVTLSDSPTRNGFLLMGSQCHNIIQFARRMTILTVKGCRINRRKIQLCQKSPSVPNLSEILLYV